MGVVTQKRTRQINENYKVNLQKKIKVVHLSTNNFGQLSSETFY